MANTADSKNLTHGDSDDDEYTQQVRNSVQLIREFYPQDARKSIELPIGAPQTARPSSDARRGQVNVKVDDGSADEPVPRKSLEEHLDEKTEDDLLKTFPISEGLTTAQAQVLLEKYGNNELPEKITPKWLVFLRLLWQPMPVMIWAAAIIEIIIENYIDTGILIAINLINATLSFYETTKAGDAVAALKASLKPTASCFRDGKWDNNFDARFLVPGDLVELAAGRAVPADCMLNTGTIDTDESAMTGESLPVTLHEREMAKMGGTVARGETHATVVLTGKNTFFGKTATLLGSSTGRSNLQVLLLKIIVILCILAFVLCITAFGYLLGRKISLKESASFAVVVIVASIPMAVEIVTTTTLAIGSKQMSHYGAIVSRLAAIDDLAGLNMLCSDKTGTLTKNKMTIQPDAPTYVPDLTQMDLKQAAQATKWDSPPKDALDTLFLRCHLWDPTIQEAVAANNTEHPDLTQAERDEFYNSKIADKLAEQMQDFQSLAYMPFDPRVKRTESTVKVKSTGVIYKVTKGAPHILLALDKDEAKGAQMMNKVTELGEDGIRAVAIAVSDPITDQWVEGAEEQNINTVWHITGMLTFLDPPRDDTKETIARSQAYGVPVRMITGDHLLIARKTCRDLAMGNMERPEWPLIQGPDHLPMLKADGKEPDNLVRDFGQHIQEADGFAQVYPEHKFLVVETFRQLGYKCGMTGDGVNDAPALKRADVGIAVAGATDAARAAADIVLTQEGLSTIIHGMEISRSIFARMKSFLTYRIAATLQLLFFFFIAVFAFNPTDYADAAKTTTPDYLSWPPFFSLPVIYLMIITLINDGTLISIGYDHASPSKYPERWILPILFLVSISLAAISCLSSLLWVHFCLESWAPNSLFQNMGIGGLTYGQIVNTMFLKVAVSDILTLFSARTAQHFFFQRKPHPVLLICCLIALCISTILALTWPPGTLDNVPVRGLGYDGQKMALWTWIYCIIVFFIQDAVKVGIWRLIIRYNLFNVNNVVHDPLKRKGELDYTFAEN